MRTDALPLEALEHALIAAKDQALADLEGLIHHSDRGSQYVSIRYTEHLADAGINASVGSAGDAYDNALAETVNGLYKTELIYAKPAWPTVTEVEFQTMNLRPLVEQHPTPPRPELSNPSRGRSSLL